tara:strand:+ start:566 stop:679 length:114 start_codon:yes stop_codon:yes gene_type:complete
MKNYLRDVLDFAYDNPGWSCFFFIIGWILGVGIKDLL